MFLIFFLVLIGFKIYGVLFGFIIGPIIAYFYAKKYCIFPKSEKKIEIKKLFLFMIPITLFYLGIALIMNIDILFLKRRL